MSSAIAVKRGHVRLVAANRDARLAIAHLLEPGVSITGISKGQFSLIDLIRVVLAYTGPAEVDVTTWTPGAREIDEVAMMLQRHEVTRFRLLVDRSFVSRHQTYVERVRRALGDEAIIQTRTHAKFARIGNATHKIVIRTSMNFNRNPRWEQFDLDDNADIYAHICVFWRADRRDQRAFRRQQVPGGVMRMTREESRSG